MRDLGVSDSKFSHSYPFFSAYIVVWYFLVEMVCCVVYFGTNSVPFFSFRLVVDASRSWCEIEMLAPFVRSVKKFYSIGEDSVLRIILSHRQFLPIVIYQASLVTRINHLLGMLAY